MKLRLIAVKKVNSVNLYVHIKTLQELSCMEERIASGKLNSDIITLFNHLLSHTTIASLKKVYIDLPINAFNKARQLFSVKGQGQLRGRPKAEDQENTTKNQTQVSNLPLELIDIILQSAVLLHMLSKESRTGPTDFIRKLLSVDQCWFQRITRRRLKKTIWRRLAGLSNREKRKSTVIRNNETYLLENIQAKPISIKHEKPHAMQDDRTNLPEKIHSSQLIRTMHKADCLTDVQTRLIKSVERNIAKNAELLHVIRSIDDKGFNVFVQCLRESNQRFATRVVDMGGVVVKVQLESDRTATKEANKQLLLERLNSLQDKKKSRSEQTEKLLSQLSDDKMEILNSVNDRQIVGWIWCQSQEALQKLQTMIEYNSLSGLFGNLLESIPMTKEQEMVHVALKMKNDGINEPVSINIDKDQLRQQVVDYKLVVSACTTLNVKSCGVVGVTKLKDKIVVLYHANVFLVFDDRSPFELKEEFEAKELKNPRDIVSNEKENCLYVICGNGRLWKLTDDRKVVPLRWNFAGRPYTLSVSGDGQLVRARNGTSSSSLEIYGADGEHAYMLPNDFRNPLHAVKTSTGNFVILHEWFSPTKNNWMRMLSELAVINGELQPTRRFFPRDDLVMDFEIHRYIYQGLEGPIYLSLDSDDRVFIAEQDTTIVTLLDSDLNWMQILCPPNERDIRWPKRICYDKDHKQLIVVVNRGAGVNVYTLTNG